MDREKRSKDRSFNNQVTEERIFGTVSEGDSIETVSPLPSDIDSLKDIRAYRYLVPFYAIR